MPKPKSLEPINFPSLIDFDELGEDKLLHMRKILKNYKELNKLYDLCLKKIETRAEINKK